MLIQFDYKAITPNLQCLNEQLVNIVSRISEPSHQIEVMLSTRVQLYGSSYKALVADLKPAAHKH
ncbi:hypothetical protein [Paenibacillus sp. Y412MC10]|uniref:hypothetical protein n=1 Tax=Geobacillus sp. (strain Y412MC10) TaxID=481743 RepID=UPI0011A7715B|nr:hypothetical protein [Paenibacillus sp. Y412MC10]